MADTLLHFLPEPAKILFSSGYNAWETMQLYGWKSRGIANSEHQDISNEESFRATGRGANACIRPNFFAVICYKKRPEMG